jgi:hypothetical protein
VTPTTSEPAAAHAEFLARVDPIDAAANEQWQQIGYQEGLAAVSAGFARCVIVCTPDKNEVRLNSLGRFEPAAIPLSLSDSPTSSSHAML